MATIIRHTVLSTWALLLLSALGGCIREDNGNCPGDGEIYLKVVDSNNNDITAMSRVKKADVFVFGSDGNFIRRITLTQEQIISRAPIPVGNNVNVAVWANIGASERFSPISTMPASSVTLASDANDRVTAVSDLFHGTEGSITRGVTKEVVIAPKTARLFITVVGIDPDAAAQDYSLRIKQRNNGYTFLGNPLHHSTEMPATMESESPGTVFTPDPINVIHYMPGDSEGIEVSLLDRNGTVIARVDKDMQNNPIVPLAGQMANVLIDISSAELNVKIRITDWDTIYQWTDF